ncbi:MAG: hypothetical protein MR911_10705 [Spirochaetia bacterium]|nr:hypothetical protein [Spirochaetia bacterium]
MDNKKVYKKIDVIKLLDLQCEIMHCTIDLRYTEDEKKKSEYLEKAHSVDKKITELILSSALL